jgi:D-sedoheptulose 7-phosphate isomerase
MDIIQRIEQHFVESIKLKTKILPSLTPKIYQAAQILTTAVQQQHKILICGNGGSASDAQHFTAELINRFEMERPSLAALDLTTNSAALTAIANDYAYQQIFAKQIQGLGMAGDVLVAISTSGNSANIVQAIITAQQQQLNIIALTGRDGGEIAHLIRNQDIELRVEHPVTARIQEVHILIIHCLCDAIDQMLYEDDE